MRGILKLERDDPEAEEAFGLEFLRSLTTQQRFDMMLQRSREILESLIEHGHRRPVEVVKRRGRPLRGHRRCRIPGTRLRARGSRDADVKDT